jgi:hypothetical protein
MGLSLLCVALASAAFCSLSLAQEWRPLFAATSMDGWESTPKGRTTYKLVDGMLVSQPDSKGMLRYSREALGNCTLKLVYKMSNNAGNAGVFIRIPTANATEQDAIHKGIEVQIDDRDDEWHSSGTLYSMTKAMARPYTDPESWNTLEITLDGLRTIVLLNGTMVTNYDGVSEVPAKRAGSEPIRGPRPEKGYIGLQNHDSRATITFKEISVRPLR